MKVVIDTSSLLALVRYYLPFDKDGILYNFFEQKIRNGNIIVIDKVFEECSRVSKGIVIEKLPFLVEKKLQTKTDLVLPNEKFFNMLENQFCNQPVKKQLNDVEFDNSKQQFLQSADAKIILYSMNTQNSDEFAGVAITTEESVGSNDNKVFKKIPAICKILNLKVMTLPELLTFFEDIQLSISSPE